jgi:hypothetical protein
MNKKLAKFTFIACMMMSKLKLVHACSKADDTLFLCDYVHCQAKHLFTFRYSKCELNSNLDTERQQDV